MNTTSRFSYNSEANASELKEILDSSSFGPTQMSRDVCIK